MAFHQGSTATPSGPEGVVKTDSPDSSDNTGSSDFSSRTPYGNTRVSEEECRRILRRLETIMRKDRPFTDRNLKIGQLAAMVGTSAHALSFVFNQHLKRSYYDYVNQFRVEEFKRLSKELDMTKYTLSAVAEKCGFSSRASFFRYFKASTGMTPSEFLRN